VRFIALHGSYGKWDIRLWLAWPMKRYRLLAAARKGEDIWVRDFEIHRYIWRLEYSICSEAS